MFDIRGLVPSSQLSSVILWIIFGYIGTILNCDLQRLIRTSAFAVHFTLFVAILFLFELSPVSYGNNNDCVEKGGDAPPPPPPLGVLGMLLRATILYILLLALTHCKWYFVLPVLLIILVDQLVDRDFQYRVAIADDPADKCNHRRSLQIAHNVLIGTTVALMVIGSIQYAYLQKIEYGDDFDWIKFWFMIPKCKDYFPDYSAMMKLSKSSS